MVLVFGSVVFGIILFSATFAFIELFRELVSFNDADGVVTVDAVGDAVLENIDVVVGVPGSVVMDVSCKNVVLGVVNVDAVGDAVLENIDDVVGVPGSVVMDVSLSDVE